MRTNHKVSLLNAVTSYGKDSCFHYDSKLLRVTKFIWLLAERGICQALVTAEAVQLVCWKSEKEEEKAQFGVLFWCLVQLEL